jgi:hypothetical protein
MTSEADDLTPPGGLVIDGPWTPRVGAVLDAEPTTPLIATEVSSVPAVFVRPARRRAALVSDPLRTPAVFTDRSVASAHAVYSLRVAGRLAARGPFRLGGAAIVGAARGSARWWHWVWADDLAAHLADADGKLGREVFVIREHRQTRWRISGAVLGTAGVGEAVGWWLTGDTVALVSGAALLGGLALAGRRRGPDAPKLLDGIERDIRLELAPEHLNAAFRAAGLLRADVALILRAPVTRDRAGRGWETVFDLPMGGGKTAAHAIAKRDVIAAELGVDEIQLILSRIRAGDGGNGKRLSLWVCDDDPYIGRPLPSPLARMERFDFWGPVPFGRDARASRVEIPLLWQSAFFGGLPRRGKTFSMRLLVAAAVLDPWCRIYLADGKGGADFRALAGVAHRYVRGADEADLEAFEAMLDELIGEMSRRFALFATLPTSQCPEGKLTPDIMRRYNMPLIPVVIDELQEYFEALETEKDRARIIGKLARIARRGPAAGLIPVYASQRPDAKSVPTKLREIVSFRYCTQVIDKTSSDMVLGDGKAAAGADASVLSEDHVGVGVLVTGPASFVTVKADLLDGAGFEAVCTRGRALRVAERTLTGQAAGDIGTAAAEAGYVIPQVIGDVMEAFGARTRMWTADLLAALVNLDEDTYGDWDADKLAADLEVAGVKRLTKQVKINGENRAGYLLRDIEGAIPPEVLAARPVEGATPTSRPLVPITIPAGGMPAE